MISTFPAVLFASSKWDWGTPPDLMDALRREYGRFHLDPCAKADTAKADDWYGPGSPLCEDGLAVPWFGKVFVNPPFGPHGAWLPAWVKKCYEEAATGRAELVVALLPARSDTRWWHQYVLQATERRELAGRVRFLREGASNSATYPSVVVVWRRGQLGRNWVSGWDWRKEAGDG